MQEVQSKFAKSEPFTLTVSNAIRHHAGMIAVYESKRQIAFDARDAALDELNEMTERDSPEAQEAKVKHSDAMRELESLATQIKFHRGELAKSISTSDEPSFEFMAEPPPPPPKEDPQQKHLPRPGPVKPEAPDPSMGDGVDEHLKAPVKELDLPEKLIGKLENAGLTTVGRVVVVLESQDIDITVEADISGDEAVKVAKAVDKFRRKHRKAMVEAEKEAAGV